MAVVGKEEAKSLEQQVLSNGPELSIERFPDGLPAANFVKYTLVILGPGTTSYGPADCDMIQDFVSKGGRLLLIQQAPKQLCLAEDGQDRGSDYLFGRSFYHRDPVICEVRQANDPLLKGVLEVNASPEWLKADVLLKNPEFENLIGGNGEILVGRARIGAGAVYYVGHELFRMLLTQRPERHEDAESWKILLANIIADRPHSRKAP